MTINHLVAADLLTDNPCDDGRVMTVNDQMNIIYQVQDDHDNDEHIYHVAWIAEQTTKHKRG